MEYPKVKNAHIVPRAYLRRFSCNGNIAVHVDDRPQALIQKVENAGTRRTYYRRTRPDGSEIDDVEWSLSRIEERAAPALARIASEWPSVSLDDKVAVAQLFASQLLRVPLWMDWYASHTREQVAEYRRTDEAHAIGTATINTFEEHLLDSSTRLTRMLELGFKLMPILASMHWTLVEFRRPLLATSDQPVVLWPLDVWAREPMKTPSSIGIFNTIEIRAPIAPTHLVLMTWADVPDDQLALRPGSRHHAASVNAFTIAQSDRQWFHLPDFDPPRSGGRLCPISPELVFGYDADHARLSSRRGRTSQIANATIGESVINEQTVRARGREVQIVTMS